MTTLAVAMLVSDANRVAAAAALSALVEDYTIGFVRPCCAADTPNPTWETPPTHWYNNDGAVDQDLVTIWQDAIAAAEPEDPIYGFIIFTAINAENALAWAATNLASQNLMFVPDEE